jgi:hypothetical protein
METNAINSICFCTPYKLNITQWNTSESFIATCLHLIFNPINRHVVYAMKLYLVSFLTVATLWSVMWNFNLLVCREALWSYRIIYVVTGVSICGQDRSNSLWKRRATAKWATFYSRLISGLFPSSRDPNQFSAPEQNYPPQSRVDGDLASVISCRAVCRQKSF